MRHILLAVLVALTACAATHHHPSSGRNLTEEEVNAFPSFPFENKRVFVIGKTGPPILLIHELPGLTKQCFLLAQALAKEGYVVYTPLLFGHPGHTATKTNTFLIVANGEWKPLRGGRTAPIASFLRKLADHIHETHTNAPMGVIGMCLSGHLPVALLDRPYVQAAVLSQPSLPLRKPADLALDQSDIKKAKARGVKMLGFRFDGDTISPPEKKKAFVDTFGEKLLDFETLEPENDGAHATLTVELFEKDGAMKSEGSARRAYDKVRCYLGKALRKEVAHDCQ